MKSHFYFNQNQLLSIMSLMLLSPALRLFPSAAAETAAQASALTALASLPFVLAYLYFMCTFMDMRNEGEGLSELSLRALGGNQGKAALIIESAWLLLYSGFVLRISADRMMTTIYPYSSPKIFIIVMEIICLIAALGSARTIVRTAKLLLPAVLGVFILILLFGIFSIDKVNLLPVTTQDFIPILKGSIASTDIFILIIYLTCFLAAFTPKTHNCFKSYSIWVLLMILIISALCIAIIGSFGAELTAKLSWPFFSFVRNIVLFHTLEHTEALVVAIWMFPDFLLVSMLIYASQHSLRMAFGEKEPEYRGEKLFSMQRKRWIIPLCSIISTIIALIMAPSPTILELWSKKLIPVINMVFAFIFIPGIYAISKIKKKPD